MRIIKESTAAPGLTIVERTLSDGSKVYSVAFIGSRHTVEEIPAIDRASAYEIYYAIERHGA
jgi:hypothetical protein